MPIRRELVPPGSQHVNRGGAGTSSSRRHVRALGLALCSAFICVALSSAPALAALPDGRVYEPVSPVASEGNAAVYVPAAGSVQMDVNSRYGGIITSRPFEVAPDGETLVYPGDPPPTGGGGSIGQSNGDEYLARRSPGGGWTQTDIQPLGSPTEYNAFSSDLALGILKESNPLTADAPANCTVLYSRTNSDGAFHAAFTTTQTPGECGNSEFAGISADNSRLLFTSTAALIPNAVSGQNNLYESIGGQPYLVNVLPNGKIAAKATFGSPSFKEAQYEHEPDLEHVISADGSRIFWTDGSTGDLYLRENATQPQSPIVAGHCTEPSKACTLEVSASEKTNGSGPAGTDPDGPRPAQYWTASGDGSKAFFTSPEELTNDANTGRSPAIGRANLDGTAASQSLIPAAAKGVTLDGSHVYWANPAANAIARANLDGTGVELSFITGASNPQGVAVDASHVYWTNAASGTEEKGTIGRANLDGSGVEQSFITGASDPQGIALDSAHVYWANAATSRIGRANLDGTSPEQSFTGASNAQGIAVDSAHIYWSNPASNLIGRANLDGTGAEQSFITGASDPQGIAVDSAHVYWSNASTGTIGRANLDGTGAEQSFIAGASNPQGVAVDASHVYWASNAGDRESDLYRFEPKAPEGERLTDLTAVAGADVQGVVGASEDGSYVYFVAGGVLASNENGAKEKATLGSCQEAAQTTEREEETLGHIPSGRGCNLYLFHGGEPLRFIAALPAIDDHNPVPFTTEHNYDGDWQAAPGYRTAEVTPDGHSLIFMSNRSLTGYNNEISFVEPFFEIKVTEAVQEVFRYEAEAGGAGELRCVSCNPTGEAPVSTEFNTHSEFLITAVGGYIPITETRFPGDTSQPRVLSEDGNRVFFDSAEPLVPQDVNGWMDVYEWERNGTGTCRQSQGCIYLLSGGTSPESSWLLGASANGNDVFIITKAQLVAQDRNGSDDVYDARVGGVQPPSPPACTGTGCQGVPPAPPIFATPSSVTFSGVGNFPPPPPGKAKTAAQIRAEKLARALKVCHAKKNRHRRAVCEAQARKRYGPPHKAKKSSRARKAGHNPRGRS
jgi:virginiamycin B lyase